MNMGCEPVYVPSTKTVCVFLLYFCTTFSVKMKHVSCKVRTAWLILQCMTNKNRTVLDKWYLLLVGKTWRTSFQWPKSCLCVDKRQKGLGMYEHGVSVCRYQWQHLVFHLEFLLTNVAYLFGYLVCFSGLCLLCWDSGSDHSSGSDPRSKSHFKSWTGLMFG